MSAATDDRTDGATILGVLAAERAIHGCVLRYCRGVDRADASLTRSAYHPDATDDHGRGPESAWTFAERVNDAHAARWSSTLHMVGNHLAVVDGDAANAETYVVAYLRRKDATGTDVVAGRYLDRFEARQGRWAIAVRTYVCEWSAVLPPGGDPLETSGYAAGRRDGDDPSRALMDRA